MDFVTFACPRESHVVQVRIGECARETPSESTRAISKSRNMAIDSDARRLLSTPPNVRALLSTLNANETGAPAAPHDAAGAGQFAKRARPGAQPDNAEGGGRDSDDAAQSSGANDDADADGGPQDGGGSHEFADADNAGARQSDRSGYSGKRP